MHRDVSRGWCWLRAGGRLIAGLSLAWTVAAAAADSPLLIETQPDGSYRLWHTEGETRLTDDEILDLAATARPEGGQAVQVGAGVARAYELAHGVRIEVAGPARDRALLVDRDACGGLKIWHDWGTARLSEAQMTELVLSALPSGGKPVLIGEDYAKAFTNPLGVVAVIWKPVRR